MGKKRREREREGEREEKDVEDEHFFLCGRFVYMVQVQINDENCEVMRSTAR